MRKKLNTRIIECLDAPGPKRVEVWDAILPGFGVRVSPGGRKAWFAVGRVAGRLKRHTIGTFPTISLAEAREAARTVIRDMQLGTYRDTHEIEAKPQTFADVIPDFIERYAKPKNRKWKTTERDLNKFAELLNQPLGEIVRADVIKELDRISAAGAPIGANRALAAIKKLFAWSLDRGIVAIHPIAGLKKPSPENQRDRVLTDDEIDNLWSATATLSFPFGPLLRLLLITGQRRGEVGGMRWSQIDLDQKIWKIPATLSKNKRAHDVPLSELALEIITSIPRFDGADLIFTTTGKTAVSGYGRVKARIDIEMGVTDWCVHDLRRTAASCMARIGVAPHVIEKVLNHVSGTISGVAAVYNRHGYQNEKREALQLWATHLRHLLNDRQVRREQRTVNDPDTSMDRAA